jgi:hypothetical protein
MSSNTAMSSPKLSIGFPAADDFDGLYFSTQALRVYHADVMRDSEIVVVDNNPDFPIPAQNNQASTGWQRGLIHSQETIKLMGSVGRQTEEGVRQTWGKANLKSLRYVSLDSPRGTAVAKNAVFEKATGDIVLCLDSHVLMWPGSLRRLLDWFDANPDFHGLVQGPMIYDGLATMSTHYNDQWGTDAMWGTWGSAWRHDCGQTVVPRPIAQDKVGFYALAMGMERLPSCPTCGKAFPQEMQWYRHEPALNDLGFTEVCQDIDSPAFEIPACGMGCFACRRPDWLWYNRHFRGFGGEEHYIHERYRRMGRKTLCLPFLRWVHRFPRVHQGYKALTYDKARNYVIGHTELGLPLQRVHDAFIKSGKLKPSDWDVLMSNPSNPPESSEVAQKQQMGPSLVRQGSGIEWRSQHDDMKQWLLSIKQQNHDYKGHEDILTKLASESHHVTELGGKRPSSTVCLLAGAPKQYLLVDPQPGMELPDLARLTQGSTDIKFFPKRSEQVEESAWHTLVGTPEYKTDLLLIDTVHNAGQLGMELAFYASRVRRHIAIHDTTAHAIHGQDGQEGMLPAIKRFVESHTDWFIMAHERTGFGLTVLSCNPADMPAEPIHLWAPDGGPGTEMKAILSSFNINPAPNCDCNGRMIQMNMWGSRGCRANRDIIVQWLRDGAPRWNWEGGLASSIKTVASGGWKSIVAGAKLMFKVSPTDPIPGLVDESIRRAEDKGL